MHCANVTVLTWTRLAYICIALQCDWSIEIIPCTVAADAALLHATAPSMTQLGQHRWIYIVVLCLPCALSCTRTSDIDGDRPIAMASSTHPDTCHAPLKLSMYADAAWMTPHRVHWMCTHQQAPAKGMHSTAFLFRWMSLLTLGSGPLLASPLTSGTSSSAI